MASRMSDIVDKATNVSKKEEVLKILNVPADFVDHTYIYVFGGHPASECGSGRGDSGKCDSGKCDSGKGDSSKGESSKGDPSKDDSDKGDSDQGAPSSDDSGNDDPKGKIERFSFKNWEWEELTPMPHLGLGSRIAVYENQVWLLGGYNKNRTEVLKNVYVYNAQNGVWISMKPMLTARADFAAEEFGGKLVVLGGISHENGETTILDGVEAYDSVNNEWTRLPSMQRSRTGHGVGVVENVGITKEMFIALGGKGLKPTALDMQPSIEFLKIGDSAWGNLMEALPVSQQRSGADFHDDERRRFHFEMVAANDQLYAVGGNYYNTIVRYKDPFGGFGSFEKIYPGQREDSKDPRNNKTRRGMALAAVGRHILTVGGYFWKSGTPWDDIKIDVKGVPLAEIARKITDGRKPAHFKNVRNVALFDPDSHEWTTLPEMRTPRSFAGVALINPETGKAVGKKSVRVQSDEQKKEGSK